ncbi:MAG: nucleotidyltransferase family protein [Silvibacterium sp.]
MNSLMIGTETAALKIPPEAIALIAALQLREPDTSLLQVLSDQEWTSLLTFSDLAHLTLPLAQLPGTGFPSWVVERLAINSADNALRFERVKASYKEAADALDHAGIEHIVIKGFAQAPEYVKDARLRAQSDIDLYCPAEKIKSAQIALQSIGYVPNKEVDYSRADHAPTMVRTGNWKWQGNPFDPEMPLSIELHFCLWNEATCLFPIRGVDAFWDRRIKRVVEELSFPSLSPLDQLGYFALHILRNVLPNQWVIHHVRELAVFLHSHATDDAFWKDWSETHDPSLRQLEAIAFYYAHAWFDCRLHQQVENAIANIASVQQRWLHRFAGSALEVMFHQNKDSVWLHLSLLESFSKKLILLKQTFVPTHISSIDSTAVKVDNRRLRGLSGAHPFKQYVAYLASRSASYSSLSVTTLLRGIRWRFSPHQLVRQFWIFLAASFFLTWACRSTSFSSIFF